MSGRWTVPRLWPGMDVFIIGGGPSFKKIDQSKLKQLHNDGLIRVIGINKAYKHIPDSGEWIDLTWFGDDIFYKIFSKRTKDGIYTFPGLRVTCASPRNDKDVKFIGRDRKKGHGISTKPNVICWNKSSGGSAINLAYHLTGSDGRCFLLGYDMKRGKDNRGHWHDGYANEKNPRKDTFNVKIPFSRFLTTFPAIARDAKKLNYKIYNVCPGSAIDKDLIPQIDFNKAIELVMEKNNASKQNFL